MKHRKGKIDLKTFNKLFYEEKLPNKKIAERFGIGVSAIGRFRHRYGLPPRGWSVHPMLGRRLVPWNKGKKCPKTSGDNNPNWKGGRYTNVYGYVWVKTPDGTINSYRGYMLEHRYVMQEHLRRPLKSSELVHHIDGNKLNNHIDNLMIYNRSTHAYLHFPKGSKFGIHNNQE